ncbi:glucosaminidase domain-containing protein [Pedobacter alpinus]|uniref:Peptidoglycan hydrolase n=1 Tax=Pedobacter alpinus TaxID=1590643 RepID=A0ABW5TMV3_9SPHI
MIKKNIFILFVFISYGVFGQSVTQNYIDTNKDKAIALMNEHHVPASIILAVAIHESASGTSKIARYLNNHFGIKGPNSNTQIKSAYRDFDKIEDSYDYFIEFLRSRSKFNVLFESYTEYDYKNWAKGIQRGGYAASRSWASQIIATINRYNLQELDNRPDDYIEPTEPVEVIAVQKTYKVKSGDTLSTIAKKYHTTTKKLILKNRLKTTVLQIGQKLKI